jgi:hypothetical protein
MAEIETARQEAQRILGTHKPDPLEDAKVAELDTITAAAERELKGA